MIRGIFGIALSSLVLVLETEPTLAQSTSNFPASVLTSVSNQIRAYFPGENLRSIPWLDLSVDWKKFENWPDEFQYKGKKFTLGLSRTGSDFIGSDISRKEAGTDFAAGYGTPGPKQPWEYILKPSVFWHGGKLFEGGVQATNMQDVIGFQWYPTGELYTYRYDEKTANGTEHYRMEYYTKSGKMIGFLIYEGAKSHFEWEGKRVSNDAFSERAKRLFKEGQ